MQSSQLPPVIAIFGPTGVGKTAASVELALWFNGEIVNADSRYMYRGLQIGVAKPTLEERKGVRHRLIDLYEPSHLITIAEVQKLAYAAINAIHERGLIPILVGGTPLYMNAITQGWSMPEVEPDWEFRSEMDRATSERGVEWLADQVLAVDPVSASRSAGNARRLIRALEIHRETGRAMSEIETKSPPPYTFLNLALSMPREKLYERIDHRIQEQIESGWIEEVQRLLASGLSGGEPAFTSIGYRQLASHIRGELSLEEASTAITHANHRYVRHQMTWLRRRSDLEWFDTTDTGWMDRLVGRVEQFLAQISTSEP